MFLLIELFKRFLQKQTQIFFIEESAPQFIELFVIEYFSPLTLAFFKTATKLKFLMKNCKNSFSGVEILEYSCFGWFELAEDRFVLLSNGH